MANSNQNEKMGKTITSLNFSNDDSINQSLISLANRFASLPENEGIPATSLLRNFFCQSLRAALERRQIQENQLSPTG